MFRRNRLLNAINIYGPVDQARRVIELWLKQQDRSMHRRDRERLAGLMARYFENEDQLTDQLMMSFLNHYIGDAEVDMEDPVSVRMEIKSLLDKSVSGQSFTPQGNNWPLVIMAAVGMIAVVVITGLIGWQVINLPLSDMQQNNLKGRVEMVAGQTGSKTAAIWTRIKKPLDVRRYQDITYWQYDDAMKELDRIAADAAKP